MSENPGPNNSGLKPPERPPNLVPPDGSEQGPKTHSRTGQLLVLGVGLLLVVVALAVLFLPAKQEVAPVTQPEVPQQAAQPAAPATQPTAPAPPLTPKETAGETAQEVNRQLEQWLRKQAAAEAENISAWGGEAYAEATARARECEQLLVDKQLTSAGEACAAAIAGLDELMASKQALLAEALATGFQALEQRAVESATDQFQRALAIDPDNAQAATGLRRAGNLPEVLRLMETGQLKEQVGDTAAALQAYNEASTLDPDFAPARENLDRLRGARAASQFNRAMSRALQALDRGDLSAAESALRQARSHKNNDPALRDLQRQLDQAQLARKLDGLRQKSSDLEKNEKWTEALKACEQALALDSSAAFAITCRDKASRRIELDGRLQAILSRPERLFTDAPLEEARQVLGYASQLSPRGPRLGSQIDQLSRLIRQAEAEVEVVILSDGLTDVVVYHVGRLGRFQSKKLVLRTGNYTATGSRNGYRDVRQTLKVRPDSGNLTFTLRCEEPI